MNTKTIFRRLGLPKHADIIYDLLRNEGPMIATRICEKTGLHRPTVYRALGGLISKRFVHLTTRGRRKHYQAADPRRISQAFSSIETDIATRMTRKAEQDPNPLPGVRFLEEFEGVRAAFDDVITHMKRGGTFYRYTSERDLDRVNRYLSPNYRKLRDRKKLERLVISNPISGKRKRPRLERFVKFIPSKNDSFEQDVIQLIYGDRLSFIDINTERVMIIENRALAEFQKVIFRKLYDKLPLP